MLTEYTRTSVMTQEEVQAAAPALFATQPWPDATDRYGFVNSGSIAEALQEAGYGIVWATQTRKRDPARIPFAQHYFRVRNLRQSVAVIEGAGRFEIILMNSHDGTSSFSVRPCIVNPKTNVPIIAAGSMLNYRSNHTTRSVAGVVDAISEIAATFPRVAEVISEMQNIVLTDKEVQEFANEAGRLRYGGKKAPFEFSLLAKPQDRAQRDDKTLWTVLNVVLENSLCGGQNYTLPPTKKRAGSIRTVRGLRRIYGIAQVSVGIWNLAEQKLKERKAN